jgi:hypothetical protein
MGSTLLRSPVIAVAGAPDAHHLAASRKSPGKKSARYLWE